MAKTPHLRKALAGILTLALIFSLCSTALAEESAASTPTAAPSRQTLLVDGKPATTEAYAIGGNNYFKLRDIAQLLTGTEAQFSVTSDDAKHVITIATDKAYTPVGGELVTGSDNSATCVPSDWKLVVDGTEVPASVYALGGNNFFRLRDLGFALRFVVDYDAEKDAAVVASKGYDLTLDGTDFTTETLTVGDKTVTYKAYYDVLYCAFPFDVEYQSTNIFVPADADDASPILLKSGTGGYMAATRGKPTSDDVMGRALAEGFVVVSPSARGRNVTYKDLQGNPAFYGCGPANVVDLKAAVRYLRYNDSALPGDLNKIIIDGTSASGAMGAILGTSGDSALYDPWLDEIGAADTSDAVFAVMNFCPIVDLENADTAYQWYMNGIYTLSEEKDGKAVSTEMKADWVDLSKIMAGYYPDYLGSLGLKHPETGKALTLGATDTYTGYLMGYILDAAQAAVDKDGVAALKGVYCQSDSAGKDYSGLFSVASAVAKHPNGVLSWKSGTKLQDFVTLVERYKSAPSFNAIPGSTGRSENSVFGSYTEENRNFDPRLEQALTDLKKLDKKYEGASYADLNPADYKVADAVKALSDMYNPMYWIGNKDKDISTFAAHFYVRVGTQDPHTSLSVATNYATALMNAKCDVDFHMQWNTGHAGDYELDEMFTWLDKVCK